MAILEQPPVPGQRSGMLEQIRAALPVLSPAEQRIGRQILNNPGQAIALSINEFAALCEVAQPTVSKFCRSIGVSSYAALRLGLSHDFAARRPMEGKEGRLNTPGEGKKERKKERKRETIDDSSNPGRTGRSRASLVATYPASAPGHG